MNHVKKHPSSDTLAEVRGYGTEEPQVPSGWERMTDEQLSEWIAAEKAEGWAPVRNLSQSEIWQQKLDGTITDAQTGITIKANEQVRNLLSGQLVMVATALSVGEITADTPQDIWDADGTKHTLSTAQLIGLLLRHGKAWAAMFSEFAP